MDKFDSLFQKLVDKKPPLADPSTSLVITSGNLRRLLLQFYNQGARDGMDASVDDPLSNPFTTMFGGKL
jgi:hypothetical protein